MRLNRDPQLVELIRNNFVAVAAGAHECDRKDDEGRFLRKLAETHPYGKKYGHVQGLQVFDTAGNVYLHIDTDSFHDKKLAEKLLAAAGQVKSAAGAVKLDADSNDPRLRPSIPDGASVVRVLTKNIDNPEQRSRFTKELGYDNMWIRKDEADALVRGKLPESLKQRILNYHLLNSYTGESELHHHQFGPDYDKEKGVVKRLDMTLENGVLRGSVRIRISPTYHYHAALLGRVEAKDGRLSRFDLVVRGPIHKKFFNDTPQERSTQVIAFRLATDKEMTGDASFRIPPGFNVHDPEAYLK